MAESTYYRRKRMGQCVKCGGVPVEGKTMCQACTEWTAKKHRLDWLAYVQAGVCPVCRYNKPRTGKKICEDCLKKRYAADKRRIIHG